MKKNMLAAAVALLAAPLAAPAQAQSTDPGQTATFSVTAKVDPSCRFSTSSSGSRVAINATADFGKLASNPHNAGPKTRDAVITGPGAGNTNVPAYKFFAVCNPGSGALLTYNRGTHLFLQGVESPAAYQKIDYHSEVKVGAADFAKVLNGETTQIASGGLDSAPGNWESKEITVKFQAYGYIDTNGAISKQVGDYADTFTISVVGQ